MKKLLAVGVIVLFLGLAIQPSVATVQPEEETEVAPFGFCILHVWTYATIGGYISDGLTKIKCEDLDTGKIRNRITGLFGHHFFIGLRKGHTYRITAVDFGKSKTIELLDFWNYLEIETFRHNSMN